MTTYAIFKTLHLIFMVIWFAGLLGMFHVFALHSKNKAKYDVTAVLKEMAAWRYKMLALPGMIGTWVFAIAMIVSNPAIMKTGGWLHAKILLVFLLSGFMGFIGKSRKRYAADDAFLDAGKCKMFNQIVVVSLLVIVALAVLRPF